MTPQELRNSILQLAIQGKLVGQRPEEGTAEELFQQIQEEKCQPTKGKNLALITIDETPFEIPRNWKWVRLGDVASILGGKRIPAGKKLSTQDTGYKYIRVSDMKNGSVVTDGLLYVPQDIYPSISKYVIHKEDIYITVAGTIGKVGKIPANIDGANLTENADRIVFSIINQDWLIKCLESPLIQFQIADVTTKVGQPKLAIKRIQELIFPLPPLAEQRRIVAKIEELLPYIDSYEQAWTRLEQFNKQFPVDMQKSILQMAIQGKLVEQRPEEGTAEELYQQIQAENQRLIKTGKIKKAKPLPEIKDDEKPFKIPKNWKWVRLGNLMSISSGDGLTSKEMNEAGKYPVYGGNGITGYHDSHNVSKETLVIGRVGYYCGSTHITEKNAWITDNAFITSFDEKRISMKWLKYFIDYLEPRKKASSTAQPVISGKLIYPMLMPLPPLAEQKRIVARLEELLPLCEKLK